MRADANLPLAALALQLVALGIDAEVRDEHTLIVREAPQLPDIDIRAIGPDTHAPSKPKMGKRDRRLRGAPGHD